MDNVRQHGVSVTKVNYFSIYLVNKMHSNKFVKSKILTSLLSYSSKVFNSRKRDSTTCALLVSSDYGYLCV